MDQRSTPACRNLAPLGLSSPAVQVPRASALGYQISPRLGLCGCCVSPQMGLRPWHVSYSPGLRTCRIVLLLLAGCLAAGFAHAADPPRKIDDQTIRRKLQAARADLKVEKTPLSEVVAQLEKKHAIPIRLDEAALKKAGVALDTPITASLKNVTLNAALNQLLKDLALLHVVKNGEILITARVEAAGEDLEAIGKARIERKNVDERFRDADAKVKELEKERVARMAEVQARLPGAVVDPAQAAADLDAIEKQFTRRFRAALRTELNFVRAVCDPTPEQIDQITESLEKYRADVLKRGSDVQKRLARKGLEAQAVNGQWIASNYPDARQVLRASLPRTVKAHLTGEQIERFQRELDKRNLDRTQAAAHILVAQLDRDLNLSAEQREKLTESLTSHWNAAWAQQFEVFLQQGNQFAPNLTVKLVAPFLSQEQRRIWRGSQANQANQPNAQIIFGGGMMGLGGGPLAGIADVIEEDLDDDADEPLPPAGKNDRNEKE